MNLDTRYRLNLEDESSKEKEAAKKAEIRKYIPVSEIARKGWFTFDNSAEGYRSLYDEIWENRDFRSEVYEKPQIKYCARQKQDRQNYSMYYSITWLQVARKKSRTLDVPAYKRELLDGIIVKFSEYTFSNNGVAEIVSHLNNAGVKFMVLSHLSRTYLDGAVFFDGGNPVIAYTARYNRIDNFWFTLAHELAHIVLHLENSREDFFLDDLKEGQSLDKREKEADIKAEELIRSSEIIHAAEPYARYLSEKRLQILSEELKIAPSVILGVLQHKGVVDYRKLGKYKVKVESLFPENVILG